MFEVDFIVQKILDSNWDWLKEQAITWSDKGKYFILNYDQFSSPTLYNVFTRSLVVDKKGKIKSFPFVRFFNCHETKQAAPIDLSNSDIVEKLDGSFIAAFWDQGHLVWHSRRSISSSNEDYNRTLQNFTSKEEYKLLHEAAKYIKKINFLEEDCNYTFMFELITKMTKVVTSYPTSLYGLYLIGCRDLATRVEKTELELNEIAKRLNLPRPRLWHSRKSYEEIVEIAKDFPVDFEGFVARDCLTGERVKIKLKPYLERHRLLSEFSLVNLISLWAKGEQSEIEAYFPETSVYFQEIEDKVKLTMEKAFNLIVYWQGTNIPRQELSKHFDAKKVSRYGRNLVYSYLDTEMGDIKKKLESQIKNTGSDHPHALVRILEDLKND